MANMGMLMNERIMNVHEVGQYLRCHQSTIYRLIKKDKLPYFKIGSDYRFDREQINRWMRESQVNVGR